MSQRKIKSQKYCGKSSSKLVVDISLNSSSTQNEKLTQLHSRKEFKDNVNKTVFYVLAIHGCKDIFKRADIIAEAIDKDHSRHFKKIIMAVNKKLKMMLGLKLVPCDDKNSSFILVNCLHRRPEILFNIDPKVKTKNLFLMIVLAVIMMNNDSLTEVELLRLLESLGFSEICIDNDLGKIAEVLKSFVEKQFITYAPVDNADGGQEGADIQYEYKWGIRAHHQVAKDKVLQFVSKVYDRDPSDFVEQYMKIEEEQLNHSDSEPSSEESSEND